ncbi:Hypothetical_protein [Hexamita inflata]|uniref:Hypothetical_protein n=1 Tax=Hexamita inflata TaxID=28002 RepID=A0AA86R4H8_9EUKA|nr:Hypothetical protein HINF_LOCUS14533 [Hexamita inflata]CAI9965689.1 Hypothetical protein HINF_LOCUS53334 [Hexamita inflata]
MPTQQGPNRALTESSADQFYLIRQLNFQKLVLASQFLFAHYVLRLAREVVPLYWHCLVFLYIYITSSRRHKQTSRKLSEWDIYSESFQNFKTFNQQFKRLLPQFKFVGLY